MVLRAAALCAALAVGAGCKAGDETPAETSGAQLDAARSAALRSAKTLAALGSFGDEGSVLLVVRPYAWPQIREGLLPLLTGLELPPGLDPRQAKNADELLALLLRPLGLADERDPQLPGWDIDRPITASVFESDLMGPVGSLTPHLDLTSLPTIRHQVLVPATDSAALVKGLADRFERIGGAWPELVDDQRGARAVRVGAVAVAIVPELERVRVVVVHPVAGSDDVAAAKRRIQPSPVTLPQSEAVHLLNARDNLVGALVRPWRLRPLSVLQGAQLVHAALGEVAADSKATLRARGTQVVLSSELVMSDAGADFDEVALALTASDGVLRLRMAAQLTEHGGTVVDAAQRGAGGPFTTKAREPWLELYVGANLRALLDAATPPPGLASSDRARELLGESGTLATLYTGMRYPFGLLKLIDNFAHAQRLPFPLEKLPVAAQLVWTGVEPGELPSGAVALEWPPGADTSSVTGLVSLARTDPAFAGLGVVKVDRNGHPVTMVGAGVDAGAVIHGSGATKPDALARLVVHFAPIATALAQSDPAVSRGLASLGELEARFTRSNSVLAMEAALTPTGVAASPPAFVATTSVGPTRRGALVDTKAQRCLRDAGTVFAKGLRALTTVSAESLGAVSAKVLAQAQPHLECAGASEGTAAAASALRRMHAVLAADVMVEQGSVASAALVLASECKATRNTTVCDRNAALATLPAPTLPSVDLPESCPRRRDLPQAGARISVDSRGIGVLDELVTAATLAARVGKDVGVAAGTTDTAPVELAVDRDTTMKTVRPVLEALRSAGIERVLAPLHDGDERRSLLVRIADVAKAPLTPTSHGWQQWSIGRATFETRRGTRTDVAIVPLSEMPTPEALAATVASSADTFIRATDSATWRTVVRALAGGCPTPALSLVVPDEP
ncbi:MAG: hypothetical protein AAF721_09220 [Myxococcota bacterium]